MGVFYLLKLAYEIVYITAIIVNIIIRSTALFIFPLHSFILDDKFFA